MALGSHLITVRRLKKYIDDVIGKKANLPDTSKTIIGNISQINNDLNGFQFHYSDVNVTSDVEGRIELTDVPQEAFMVTANALHNSINYSTSTPMRYLENRKWYCTLFNDTHLDIPQPNITVYIRVSWATIDGIS